MVYMLSDAQNMSHFDSNKVIGPGCSWNCSGHGQCEQGLCICLVQYSGEDCGNANYDYYKAFGAIFITLCAVAIIQLLLCMRSEYIKEGKYSMREACKVTTQKFLYFLIICATALRASYFFSRWHISETASSGLWSAYYPFLLTGFSLIVCFWAEAFHLQGFDGSKPGFLSKSVFWFAIFNIFIYMVFLGQVIAMDIVNDNKSSAIINRVCTGCFAFFIIVVDIVFLAYGIEVFFKIQGAFIESKSQLDTWQLHMSRTGLIALSLLQFITALFLASDAINDKWKDRLPILSQNLYDIFFRIAEFGVALWFPCVLWNCRRPEQLWVLNLKRIFKNFERISHESEPLLGGDIDREVGNGYGSVTEIANVKYDCFICFDSERSDAGALIQPCACKGDVATVHHDCLKKWLLECADKDKPFECNVCKEKYKLTHGWVKFPLGLKKRHWFQTFIVIFIAGACPMVTYAVYNSDTGSPVLLLTIGLTILIELVCCRSLAQSVMSLYRHVKISSMIIVGKEVRSASNISVTHHPVPSSLEVTYGPGNQVHPNVKDSENKKPIFSYNKIPVPEAEANKVSSQQHQVETRCQDCLSGGSWRKPLCEGSEKCDSSIQHSQSYQIQTGQQKNDTLRNVESDHNNIIRYNTPLNQRLRLTQYQGDGTHSAHSMLGPIEGTTNQSGEQIAADSDPNQLHRNSICVEAVIEICH